MSLPKTLYRWRTEKPDAYQNALLVSLFKFGRFSCEAVCVYLPHSLNHCLFVFFPQQTLEVKLVRIRSSDLVIDAATHFLSTSVSDRTIHNLHLKKKKGKYMTSYVADKPIDSALFSNSAGECGKNPIKFETFTAVNFIDKISTAAHTHTHEVWRVRSTPSGYAEIARLDNYMNAHYDA